VKVTPPQQRRAFTGQAVGRISGGGVIGQSHPLGRRSTTLRTPQGRTLRTRLGPVDVGGKERGKDGSHASRGRWHRLGNVVGGARVVTDALLARKIPVKMEPC
jgi:hypothetical protein